jgi:hypothetical protein
VLHRARAVLEVGQAVGETRGSDIEQ